MRKLSMKNAGTPAIDEDSESGSAGVSAEGFGAFLPRLGLLAALATRFAARLDLVPPCRSRRAG